MTEFLRDRRVGLQGPAADLIKNLVQKNQGKPADEDTWLANMDAVDEAFAATRRAMEQYVAKNQKPKS